MTLSLSLSDFVKAAYQSCQPENIGKILLFLIQYEEANLISLTRFDNEMEGWMCVKICK